MLQYTVLLFGPAASAIAMDRVVIELPESCSAGELLKHLAHQHPSLEMYLQVGRLAVNQGFVSMEAQVNPGSEIALITMVSGG